MSDSQMMRVRQQEPGEVCDSITLPVAVPDELWRSLVKQVENMTRPGDVIQVHIEIRASAFVVNRKIKLGPIMREIGRTSDEGGMVMMGGAGYSWAHSDA